MKVVVTGGSGRLGQHTIRELLAHEHQVLSLDKAPPPERLCPSWQVDLTSVGSAHEALKGVDAVIQLGAFQAPNMTSNAETFNNNVSIAFNVFQAAADMGVKRVVFASSIAAYGFIYAPQMWAPDFLPFDESHPCRPQDPYGLSKVVGERIADYFVGVSDMTAASLRITGINFDPTYEGFREVWRNPQPRVRILWTYVDGRDAAMACRLAAEASIQGHEAFNIAAPTSRAPDDTHELIRRYLPDADNIRQGLTGNWSCMDASRAEERMGFRVQHTWEQYVSPEDG